MSAIGVFQGMAAHAAIKGRSMFVTMTLLRLAASVLLGLIIQQLASMKNQHGWAWGTAAGVLMFFVG